MTERSPKNEHAHGEQSQRINRILSLAGITSRRKADDWIRSGRITVNGRLLNEPGTRATWGIDRICVDGQEIPKPSARIYLLLNKPFAYMSSLSDPQGRPLVTDLLMGVPQEWAHRMTHPRFQVPRTYKVTVPGIINDESVALLRKGVQIPDGSTARSKTSVITRSARQSVLRMTITEGKSRQVRKMVEAVGHSVVHLIRTGFGIITLGDLKVGEYRHLETVEVESMKKLVGMV